MELKDLLNRHSVQSLKKHTVNHSFQHAKRTATRHTKEKHSKLAAIRMNNMLTIKEAAQLCGVRPPVIMRWETTGTNQNDTMLSIKKYAKLLHMSLKDLLGYLE